MSHYLIEQIAQIPQITVRTCTTVARCAGEERLQQVTLRHVDGRPRAVPLDQVDDFDCAHGRSPSTPSTITGVADALHSSAKPSRNQDVQLPIIPIIFGQAGLIFHDGTVLGIHMSDVLNERRWVNRNSVGSP